MYDEDSNDEEVEYYKEKVMALARYVIEQAEAEGCLFSLITEWNVEQIIQYEASIYLRASALGLI